MHQVSYDEFVHLIRTHSRRQLQNEITEMEAKGLQK